MALVSIPHGLYWPSPFQMVANATATAATLNAAGLKMAYVGHLYLNGRTTSAKTISAAGGGSIAFRLGTTTWANAGSTLTIGLQDVTPSAGPTARPDDSFDVSVALTGGAGLTTAAWNVVSMTGGDGSKTMNHGDLFAVVFDMSARAGADSVIVQGSTPFLAGTSNFPQRPNTASYSAGAWVSSTVSAIPNVVIVFDDGTVGIIDNGLPISTTTAIEAYADATNPDERGVTFQVPFDCKADAFWFFGGASAATGDMEAQVYATPAGTPASVLAGGTPITILGEQLGNASNERKIVIPFASEISLSRNTDYCAALKATAAGNVRLQSFGLGDTSHRVFFPGGTTVAKATRNGGSGAFTPESPAVTMYQMGVRISQIPDGAAGGLPASRLQLGM